MAFSSPSPTPTLDHIILLLHPTHLASPPPSLTSHFHVIPGGTHADSLTANNLVILKDGVYIELISFLDNDDGSKKEGRQGHWWGKKREGEWIDWACTFGTSREGEGDGIGNSGKSVQEREEETKRSFKNMQDRVNQGSGSDSDENGHIQYNDPIAGGRQLPNKGERISWLVAFPSAHNQSNGNGKTVTRGEVPFWCFDTTPRSLRVPNHIDENVETHACGAVGVAEVSVKVSRTRLAVVRKCWEGGFGEGTEGKEGTEWEVGVPVPQKGTEEGSDSGRKAKVRLGVLDREEGGEVEIQVSLFTRDGMERVMEFEAGEGRKARIKLVPLDG